MSSTIQMILLLRLMLLQILQIGESLMLQQIVHCINSVFSFNKTVPRFSASSLGLFNRYITILKALRFPTPGNPDRASTAFSMVLEEKFKIVQNYNKSFSRFVLNFEFRFTTLINKIKTSCNKF